MDRSNGYRHSAGLDREPTTLTLGEFYAPTPEFTDEDDEGEITDYRCGPVEVAGFLNKGVPSQTGTQLHETKQLIQQRAACNSTRDTRDLRLECLSNSVATVCIPSGDTDDDIPVDSNIHQKHETSEICNSESKDPSAIDVAAVQKVDFRLRKKLSTFNTRARDIPLTRSSTNHFRLSREETFASSKCLSFVQFSDIKKDNQLTRRNHQRQNSRGSFTSSALGANSRNGDLTWNHDKLGSQYPETNRIHSLFVRNPSSRYKRMNIPFTDRDGRTLSARGNSNTNHNFGERSSPDRLQENTLYIEKLSTPRSSRKSLYKTSAKSHLRTMNLECITTEPSNTNDQENEHLVTSAKNRVAGVTQVHKTDNRERHIEGPTRDPKCVSLQNRFLPVNLRRQMNTPVYRFNSFHDDNSLPYAVIGKKQNFIF